MPVPLPGPEVGSDSQKGKFLMIFGRPKNGFFDQISGVPGYIPVILIMNPEKLMLYDARGSFSRDTPRGTVRFSARRGGKKPWDLLGSPEGPLGISWGSAGGLLGVSLGFPVRTAWLVASGVW